MNAATKSLRQFLQRFWPRCKSAGWLLDGNATVSNAVRHLAQRISPCPGQLPRLMVALDGERGAIHEVIARLEEQFLEITADFEQLSATSDDLMAKGERLLAMATGRTDGGVELERSLDFLRSPLAWLEECQRESTVVVSRWCDYQRLLEQVSSVETTLGRAMAPLRYIQTSFRIESARLDSEAQSIFKSLTTELSEVHHRLTQVFLDQFKGLQVARNAIKGLILRLETQVEEHQRVVQEKKDIIEKGLTGLRSALEESRSQDIRLTSVTQAIATEVGEVVLTMQFQDITRQKLEHVGSALEEITLRFANAREIRGKARFRAWSEALGYIAQSGRVQLGQLSAIGSDLAEAERKMRDAVTSILSRVGHLDEECLTLKSFRNISVADDGVVGVVLSALDELGKLSEATLILQTEAYETMRPLGSMASNLTGVISGLSQSIKMIALNAQIQATQLGAGTGLEVLSQQTCAISQSVAETNRNAASQLESLIAGLEETTRDCGILRERAEAQHRMFQEEGGALEQRVHAYRDDTLNTFHTVSDLTDQFREKAGASLERMIFQYAASSRLKNLANTIQAITSLISASTPLRSKHDSHQQEYFRTNYTMASERAVHFAAIHGASAAGAEPTNAEVPAEDGLDWFTDTPAVSQAEANYFEEKPAALAVDVAAVKSATEPDDGVEFF
jgi:hypothetical protein